MSVQFSVKIKLGTDYSGSLSLEKISRKCYLKALKNQRESCQIMRSALKSWQLRSLRFPLTFW